MKINSWRRGFVVESLKRHLNVHLRLLVVAICSLISVSADAFSPSGKQKVLVVLVDLGSNIFELCPKFYDCPPFILQNASLYRPPRNTAQQWENLLNQYGSQFWDLASYNQSQVEFTVLANPFRVDGWWTPLHSAQDYIMNESQFVDDKAWAAGTDPARYAIDSFCSQWANQVFCKFLLPQYTRLITMQNYKGRGGQTLGNNFPLALNTYTSGPLPLTMTYVNEDANDSRAMSVIVHEFGHQLGTETHYGNCAPYNNIPVPFNYMDPSFVNPMPGTLECMGFWDLMGWDWRWSQPGGFSRWSLGWIDSNTTVSYQLPTASPFQSYTRIRPVEMPALPNQRPNLIRLSRGLLSDPWFYGYFVECRVKVNGDEGLYPSSGGVPYEGLMITNVHEASIYDKKNGIAPPAHVVRPQFPAGGVNAAVLSPGGSFYDPNWDLTITFDSWQGGDGPDRLCDVFIDYGHPQVNGPIVMWQDKISPGLSSDIGINQPQQALSAPGGGISNAPLGLEPVWPNHNNVLFARAHTLGTLPAENVTLNVGITQPALITSDCGTPPDISTGQIALPPVDPVEGATGSWDFVPRPGSLGVQMVSPADPASDPAESNVTTSGLAFEFFRAGARRTRVTHFVLQANPGCDDQTLFTLLPGEIPDGWSVSVSPRVVSLAPGEKVDVAVRLRSPDSALPGENAEVSIHVHETTPSPTRPEDPALPIDSRLAAREEFIGAIRILARVVGDDAAVSLACPHPPPSGKSLSVSGRIDPAIANGTVMLEYKSPHTTVTRFATTEADGAFDDRFTPGGRGPWHVQAFWPGDAMHAPAQSTPCGIQTGRQRK